MFPRKCEPVDTPGVIAHDGRETDVDKSGDTMKRVNWTRKNRTIVGAGLAVLLFLGLTGMVRFPSVVRISRTVVCLPEEGKTQDDYVRKTDCWGIPFIYRSCTTDWELRVAESKP